MWSPVAVKSTSFAQIIHATPSLGAAPSVWSESELLERLLASDPSAWRELNHRYSRLITSCIQRVVTRFSRRISADAIE